MGLSELGRALLDGLCKMPLCLLRKVLQCLQLQCGQKPQVTLSYLSLWSDGLGTWHVVGAMNTYCPDERWKNDVDHIQSVPFIMYVQTCLGITFHKYINKIVNTPRTRAGNRGKQPLMNHLLSRKLGLPPCSLDFPRSSTKPCAFAAGNHALRVKSCPERGVVRHV